MMTKKSFKKIFSSFLAVTITLSALSFTTFITTATTLETDNVTPNRNAPKIEPPIMFDFSETADFTHHDNNASMVKNSVLLFDIHLREMPSYINLTSYNARRVRNVYTYLEDGVTVDMMIPVYQMQKGTPLEDGVTITRTSYDSVGVIFHYIPSGYVSLEPPFTSVDYLPFVYEGYSDLKEGASRSLVIEDAEISPYFGVPVTNYRIGAVRRRPNEFQDNNVVLFIATAERGTSLSVSQTVSHTNSWSTNISSGRPFGDATVSAAVGFNFSTQLSFQATNAWSPIPYAVGAIRVHPVYRIYDFDIYRNTGSGFSRHSTGQARRVTGVGFTRRPF